MSAFRNYSSADSIFALYENQKLVHMICNVIPETLEFEQPEYKGLNNRYIKIDNVQDGKQVKNNVTIHVNQSFKILPNYMKEKLERELNEA